MGQPAALMDGEWAPSCRLVSATPSVTTSAAPPVVEGGRQEVAGDDRHEDVGIEGDEADDGHP